jgi:hypothetical protein
VEIGELHLTAKKAENTKVKMKKAGDGSGIKIYQLPVASCSYSANEGKQHYSQS